MKHLVQVQEGREHAEEILANEIGDEMDAHNEQVEDDDNIEGTHEHPEMFVKDPAGLLDNLEVSTKNYNNNVYRKIDLQNDESINSKIRLLDVDQRMVVDIGVDYAKKSSRTGKHKCQRPTL